MILAVLLLCAQTAPLAVTTVGIEGRVEFVAERGDLSVFEAPPDAPLVLRIAEVVERSPTEHAYDLRFLGWRPGAYDLAPLLGDVHGTALTGTALPVRVDALLPADHDGTLADLRGAGRARLARLRPWLVAAALLWLVPLVLFVVRRARTRERQLPPPPPPRPRTLAEQLGELVRAALARGVGGAPDRAQAARLERLLVAVWRERLSLAGLAPAQALARMRADGEAGALLTTIERWLHAPPDRAPSAAEIEAALAPYAAHAAVEEVA